eukprot:4704647-Prymnesium_polylepis.1
MPLSLAGKLVRWPPPNSTAARLTGCIYRPPAGNANGANANAPGTAVRPQGRSEDTSPHTHCGVCEGRCWSYTPSITVRSRPLRKSGLKREDSEM